MMVDNNNVASLRLSAARAQARIRELAQNADNVEWSVHALERMSEREIYDRDVLKVLRKGYVEDPPEEGINAGEWKCKTVLKVRGGRVAGVVTIILRNGRLLVK